MICLMFLSEAIDKREKLLKKAKEMEQWSAEQKFGVNKIGWHEMKIAIDQVVDRAYGEWHKYNDAIENDIQQLEIEIK